VERRTSAKAMTGSNPYKHINLEYISELAGGDDEFIVEIITNYLDSVGPNTNLLYDAVVANDKETIKFLAHKLKGSFRFIGCEELGVIMEHIEHSVKQPEPGNMLDAANKIKEGYLNTEEELKQVLAEFNNR
jgi:HPt (histidine-containing phosphotransfer) domain-containing protein